MFYKLDDLKEGHDIVFKLRKTFEYPFYSYSVCGFDPDYIKEKNIPCKIERLPICFTMCNPKKYNEWVSIFNDKYETEVESSCDRIGHEDISLVLFDVPIQSFIDELESGLLFKENFDGKKKGYVGAIMRPRIIFDFNIKECVEYKCRISTQAQPYFSSRYEKEKKFDYFMFASMKVAMKNLYNSTDRLYVDHFAREITCIVNSSFERFLKVAKKECERIKIALFPDSINVNRMTFDSDLQRYVNAHMSIIRGGLQTEQMFFQIPHFNVPLFEAPSKILAVYMYFVEQLVKFLENTARDKNTKVILEVGLFSDMTARQLFNAYNKKHHDSPSVLVIKLPMHLILNPHTLMAQVVHEVAHFIGIDSRNRRLRADCMVETCCDIVIERIAMLTNDANGLRSDIYEIMYKKIHNHIKELIEKSIRDSADSNEFYLTTKQLAINIKDTLSCLSSLKYVEDLVNQLFDQIQNDGKVEYSNFEVTSKTINSVVDALYLSSIKALAEVREYHIETLFCESFSDLVMLNVCSLSEREYLELFIRKIKRIFGSDNDKIKNYFKDNFLYARIVCTFEVYYFEKDFLPCVKEEKAKDADFNVLGLDDLIRDIEDSSVYIILRHNVKKYLTKCNEDLAAFFKGNSGEAQDVKDMFKNITGNDADKFRESFTTCYDSFIKDNMPKNKS